MEQAPEDTPQDNSEAVTPGNSSTERSFSPPHQEELRKPKKDDRNKKDDKMVEQFMKTLNSLSSSEEKLSMVCKKYVQIADCNRKLQFYIKQSDKRYALIVKEKEQLQHEYNKTILVKSKLENLCRELQKQNKAIKEESLLKIREEDERRKETQAKFQNTLSEITTLLQQNNEKNAKLRDDNISMSEKFKSVVQQYQLREQQVDKMSKQMSLESQLSDAKLQKAGLEHRAEKERLNSEMEQMKVTIAQCRAKILELQGTETTLRSQLAVYTDKYDEFQNALVKSNQVFGGFKEQMENMSKKIKKLEKESLSWKKRWETSQSALLEMCGERQASEERAGTSSRQLLHMQSLCRTLQAERTVLLTVLKENNIERPPLPAPTPAPPAPPAPSDGEHKNNAKVDAMAANCAQLRQSLAHLQSQLNVLTNKNTNKEEPVKAEKQKKSKSKKAKSEKTQELERADSTSKHDEAKAVLEDNQPATNDSKAESKTVDPNSNNALIDSLGERVDDKTLESLIQAISNANISLCDLEVGDLCDQETIASDKTAVDEIKTIDTDAKKDKPQVEKSDETENLDKEVAVESTDSLTNETINKEAVIKDIEIINNKDAVTEDKSNSEEIVITKVLENNLNESTKIENGTNDEVPHIAEVKSIVDSE